MIKKFEYMITDETRNCLSAEDTLLVLNKLGAMGWELCSNIVGAYLIFKREIIEETTEI